VTHLGTMVEAAAAEGGIDFEDHRMAAGRMEEVHFVVVPEMAAALAVELLAGAAGPAGPAAVVFAAGR